MAATAPAAGSRAATSASGTVPGRRNARLRGVAAMEASPPKAGSSAPLHSEAPSASSSVPLSAALQQTVHDPHGPAPIPVAFGAWLKGAVSTFWVWARWSWQLYASVCATCCAFYVFGGVSFTNTRFNAQLCVTICLLFGILLGLFNYRSAKRGQAQEQALIDSEKRALALEQIHQQSQTQQQRALAEVQQRALAIEEVYQQSQVQLGAQAAELQQFRDRRREVNTADCKICFVEPSSCVLLPCNHHAFCKGCINRLRERDRRNARCPICRQLITGTLDTFTG